MSLKPQKHEINHAQKVDWTHNHLITWMLPEDISKDKQAYLRGRCMGWRIGYVGVGLR